jgi:site-specific recombinase XerD
MWKGKGREGYNVYPKHTGNYVLTGLDKKCYLKFMKKALVPTSNEIFTGTMPASVSILPTTIAGNSPESQVIAMWIASKSSGYTRTAYPRAVADFFSFVAKPLHQVTLSDLQAWRASLEPKSRENAVGRGWGNSKKALAVNAVKSLFKFAFGTGYLTLNPASLLKSPKVNPAIHERILPEESVWDLISKAESDRDKAILSLLYASKVRVSELVGIRWKALTPSSEKGRANGVAGSVYVVGKGGKERTIGLPLKTWERVQSLRPVTASDADYVFLGYKGKPLTSASVWNVVKKAGKTAGLSERISPHWFRHCGATHALNRGASLNLLKEELGHADLATTGLYLHASKDEASSTFLVGV